MISLATLASASSAFHGGLSGTARNAAPPPRQSSPPDKGSTARSPDQTNAVTNADGSTTVTVTSGTGSIVSVSTSGSGSGPPPAVNANIGPYTTSGSALSANAGSAGLLSLLV